MKAKIFKKRKNFGFTLIELLVVISIIGILSTLSTVAVNTARVKARDAKRLSDISQVQLALYFYYDDNLSFPQTADMLPASATASWTSILVPALNGTTGGRIYMGRVPVDPQNVFPQVFGYNGNGQEFVISFCLEEGGCREIHGQ